MQLCVSYVVWEASLTQKAWANASISRKSLFVDKHVCASVWKSQLSPSYLKICPKPRWTLHMNSWQSSWDHAHRQSCLGTSLAEFSNLPTPEFVGSPALQQDSRSICNSNCWGATVRTERDICVLCNMAVPLEQELAHKCVCHRAVASETNNPACLRGASTCQPEWWAEASLGLTLTWPSLHPAAGDTGPWRRSVTPSAHCMKSPPLPRRVGRFLWRLRERNSEHQPGLCSCDPINFQLMGFFLSNKWHIHSWKSKWRV